ncbi:MAG TPA: glycosyltransferase family 2 protein [Clostridia bacterium]|nr:glycosyltransferase family 2 protein [Clostridia bacterium]
MRLSIIIVSYNTRELLKNAIESIYMTYQNDDLEVIVVDNGSSDGSTAMVKEEFGDVILIESSENLGFAKANNIAIKQSKGKYILLLNPDTILVEDCLEKCLAYMNNNQSIGALGCKVVMPDGKLDLACRRSFPTPEVSFYRMTGLSKLYPDNKRFAQYNLTYLDENETYEVDSIVGAFMLIRREVIEQVGILDEEYFMYGEDIDWCYRIKQAGWKVVYNHEAEIVHYKGASGGKRNPRTIYEFYRAMYLFYKKHYESQYSFIVTGIIYFGIGMKLILSLVMNQLKGHRRNSI